jgi:hypothetical protein
LKGAIVGVDPLNPLASVVVFNTTDDDGGGAARISAEGDRGKPSTHRRTEE